MRMITKKRLEHLSWLSKMELSKEEKKLFQEQLNEILDYFKKLDELDLRGVEPLYHVVELKNVFREDEPKPYDPDKILKLIPKLKGRYVKAPRMK